MSTKQSRDSEIHGLTTAEIGRQLKLHSERRAQIVNERAEMYRNAPKAGQVIDADEGAARQLAKTLLNGSAPESLSLPPEEISHTRDRLLAREMRAIDIVLKILGDKDLAARAAEAVEWAEAHSGEWRGLCREITLTATKLDALDAKARNLLGQCGDIFAVRLPMANIVGGGRPIFEIPVEVLIEAALADGVVTSAEVKKASNG
jgi:hypothetical protein